MSVETDIVMLDAHVHFWDLSLFSLPWLTNVDALNRSLTLTEYSADLGMVEAAIYVEVDVDKNQRDKEIDAVAQLVKSSSTPICAMIAALDPTRQDLGEYLSHVKNNSPHVVGFRQLLHTSEHPPGTCLEPDFVSGIKALGHQGYSFDLCIRPSELSDITTLIAMCRDTQFILDHAGNPPIAIFQRDPSSFEMWKKKMSVLAALPNVVIKISGLVNQMTDKSRDAPTLIDIVIFLKALFGADRLMFGSDWPVCTLTESAMHWSQRLQGIIQHWPTNEKEAIWGKTAKRIYLDPHNIK
ncbi:amidohydrolase family protein [Enterovibrio sp. Hal110]